MLAGCTLSFFTGTEERNYIAILRAVTEIVSDGGLQHLANQVVHVSETRDHLRRLAGRYVNNLRNVEVKRETVLRTHRNGRKILIQLVRFAAGSGPVQYQVSS